MDRVIPTRLGEGDRDLQGKARTPIKRYRLEFWLSHYDQCDDAELQLNGFKWSFRLGGQFEVAHGTKTNCAGQTVQGDLRREDGRSLQ